MDHDYLRKYYPKSGEDAEFDLTPAAEKAIAWVQGHDLREERVRLEQETVHYPHVIAAIQSRARAVAAL